MDMLYTASISDAHPFEWDDAGTQLIIFEGVTFDEIRALTRISVDHEKFILVAKYEPANEES